MDNVVNVPIEMPIELIVNNNLITTFLSSPYDLEDLAIGHLLTRGLVSSISDIENIKIDKDTYQIFITASELTVDEKFSVPKFILSGVSSINKFNDEIYKISKVNQNIEFNLSSIVDTVKFMVDTAPLYNETGGIHAAIIKDKSNNFILREDIGRHSAVDKAIGKYKMEFNDFSNAFIATTGRISLDMLLKSAVMGIPIVVSLKGPSSLAIELANFYNITIVGRSLSNNPIVFTNGEKIIL